MINSKKLSLIFNPNPAALAVVERCKALHTLSSAYALGVLVPGEGLSDCLACGLRWKRWQGEQCPVCSFRRGWVAGWRTNGSVPSSPEMALGRSCARWDQWHRERYPVRSVLAALESLRWWESPEMGALERVGLEIASTNLSLCLSIRGDLR